MINLRLEILVSCCNMVMGFSQHLEIMTCHACGSTSQLFVTYRDDRVQIMVVKR